MKKAANKTKIPSLFAIEHDEELEKGITAGGENSRLLAENLKQLAVGKGHIKIPADKFTYEQASQIFANAKMILKREEFEGTFKSKSHKNDEGEHEFLYITRTT